MRLPVLLSCLTLATVHFAASAAEDTQVLVANSGDSTVSIFAATNVHDIPILRPLKVLPTGKGPSEICLSPDRKRAYISNGGESSITVLDLNTTTVLNTFVDNSMKRPDGCVVSPDGSAEIKAGKKPRGLLFHAKPTASMFRTAREIT